MQGESPYIGKARHKRNTFTSDSIDAGKMLLATGGLTHTGQLEEEPRHDLAGGCFLYLTKGLQLHTEINAILSEKGCLSYFS